MVKLNRLVIFGLVFSLSMALFLSSCSSNEPTRETFPFSVDIFHSVDGKQVAFQALTHSATSWSWDFGDGTTSTEQNPVHVYADGGYYIAILTATDSSGQSETQEVTLAIALTPYILLTGGPTAVNGRTWKLTANHSSSDYLANADAEFSVVDGTPNPLPTGVFDLLLGMGEVYQDEFTFHFDGSYGIDVKDDNAAFGGIVYQMIFTGGAGIVNANGQDFGLCTGLYESQDEMEFTYVENKDLTISSVYGQGGALTFNGVSTLDFTNTAFVGFKDFQSEVIVQEITDTSMRLVMFMAAAYDPPQLIGLNTHALILSFEVVK